MISLVPPAPVFRRRYDGLAGVVIIKKETSQIQSEYIKRNTMSRELQEKADRIIRELKDSLIPIKEELEILKSSTDEKNTRTLR